MSSASKALAAIERRLIRMYSLNRADSPHPIHWTGEIYPAETRVSAGKIDMLRFGETRHMPVSTDWKNMASGTLCVDESAGDTDSTCGRWSSSGVPFQKKADKLELPSTYVAPSVQTDVTLVSEFKQLKLEKEAQKNWDLFYKRNSTNFFKDRHWTTREFEELKACREFENQQLIMLEAGCGVGNCLFPLLEEDPNLFVYACDFSPRAIQFVKQNSCYNPDTCKAFQCDLTKDNLTDEISADSVDVATLIFVLSAIHPDKMHLAVENIYKETDLEKTFTSDKMEHGLIFLLQNTCNFFSQKPGTRKCPMSTCCERLSTRRKASVCLGFSFRANFINLSDCCLSGNFM
ncbi:tRNA N(3)-cytidine methyltransferase METTL6 isoform X2 [Dendrobates tinctorius]|uniref:tRNA N(3)-cytidine methyltransferase METTL6 isoform X2 n=1 Tax=Dendrobates tinctorius TaxID=92724 RepID=UPI003CCA6BDE